LPLFLFAVPPQARCLLYVPCIRGNFAVLLIDFGLRSIVLLMPTKR